MMKRYLLFCQLALLPTLAAQAQFTAGTDGFFVSQNTQVFIDSLTLLPTVDFTLTSQTLTISPTPIPGTPPSIARVYSLTTPVNFTGVAGFFYRASELNGNNESTLQLNHGNASYVSTTGSTVNIGQHYISNTLPLTNFTSLTAAQENALPVKLVDFQLKRMENATILYWQTSEETNSNFFEIQQSEDAKRWSVLGKIDAANESNSKRDYSFDDAAERYGTQYYRLRMVDLDGSFAYSKIQSIRLGSAGLISAYPNPVVDKLLIGSKEVLASVKMTDLTGRQFLELSKPKPGQEVSLKNYPAGTYLVKVETTSGKTQVIKIIKQ
ncbi:Por secretion system C-terminal sorting domain-containing protein [Dyadobacter sp. SG02]|uniref:T9SS type A sorting domain-containing protein n=1 Tax=Dyadobacter sp. SG02 TaxID=1855291 RepID=UPI0008AD65FA|nr:T9SS type A sorting domain-containing protein [Dyadobacter sp. SG02]SEJ48970.1 Por secretion system C-terminal sorting domain-containing protein [Dyadobacter sp. SG02]